MKFNKKLLFKLSGLSAILSGLLFIIIQVIHPSDSLSSIGTKMWMIAHILTFIFPILGIIGITGIYLLQSERAGLLGFLSYSLLFSAFILMICFGFYEAFIAPSLITEAPIYVASALSILEGKTGPQYISELYILNSITYLLGGLLFGISIIRAKVFPKWSGFTLILSILVTLSAAISAEIARPSAVLFGFSLIILGTILFKIKNHNK